MPEYDRVYAGGGNFTAPNEHAYPQDVLLSHWTQDPATATQTQIVTTAGTVHVARLFVRKTQALTNVHTILTTAGATLTASQNFIGVYQDGTLLASSAAAATITSWTGATGLLTHPMVSGPFTITGGSTIYVAFYYNGTTAPTFACGTKGVSGISGLLGATASRYGTADTGRTTSLPTTLGAITAGTTSWWVGLS